MKFNCGPTWEEKLEASRAPVDWHDYFAWFPCRVGSRDCRWFEVVERKKTFRTWVLSSGTTIAFDDWWWEYRAKGGQG